jgi:hypothetical protein
MPNRYRAPGGWRVEIVRLEGTPNRRDGTWLRVTQYGAWTADIGSVAELAQWFPLAELEPEDGLALSQLEHLRSGGNGGPGGIILRRPG